MSHSFIVSRWIDSPTSLSWLGWKGSEWSFHTCGALTWHWSFLVLLAWRCVIGTGSLPEHPALVSDAVTGCELLFCFSSVSTLKSPRHRHVHSTYIDVAYYYMHAGICTIYIYFCCMSARTTRYLYEHEMHGMTVRWINPCSYVRTYVCWIDFPRSAVEIQVTFRGAPQVRPFWKL